jgi:3-hydroxybutyryl-CoA dehydratase
MDNRIYHEITVGQKLPSIVKAINQEKIDTYGKAQGENDPIHHDQGWAEKNTIFGGTIAQGMMTMAFISQMITACFGIGWVNKSELEVKFLYPVRPGDIISTQGVVVDKIESESGKSIICDLHCFNQDNKIVLSGCAKISI